MTVVWALLAAAGNAFAVVAQNRASSAPAARRKLVALVRYLVTNPMWLLGVGSLIAAFVFQALALHQGLLSVVQALLVTELVFSLVLRRVWVSQAVAGAAWASAAFTCVCLALFILLAEPQGGHAQPTTGAWLSALVVTGAAVVALTVLGGFGSRARRAALYATAAAVVWSVEATFIKAMTDSLASFGVTGALSSWPIYAVVVGGIAGSLLVQSALHVGPLRVSQPLLVSVDPMVSVALGVWIYGEHFTADAPRVALAVVAFAGMVVGVVLITRTSPETMEPTVEVSPAPAN
jgi:hypothetical protein